MQIVSRRRYFFFSCCLLFALGARAEEQKPGEAIRAMVDAERKFYQTGNKARAPRSSPSWRMTASCFAPDR